MIVILEGPDLVGKTTIARRYEQQGYTYHHLTEPGGRSADSMYLEPLAELTGNHVFDRFYPSEIIYGPVLRGHCDLSPEQVWRIEDELSALGAKRFIVHATWPEIETRYHERGEDLVDLDQLREIYDRYQEFQLLNRQWMTLHA